MRTRRYVYLYFLAQGRGEVGQGHEGGVHFVHEFAVHLGLVVDALPFRVVLKRFPVGGGCFAAGMIEDVDQSVALVGLIDGRPVGDAFHAMAVKEFYGMLAEACQQVCQFPRGGVIDAEFVDAGLRGSGMVLLGSGPKCRRKECGGRNRLE